MTTRNELRTRLEWALASLLDKTPEECAEVAKCVEALAKDEATRAVASVPAWVDDILNGRVP